MAQNGATPTRQDEVSLERLQKGNYNVIFINNILIFSKKQLSKFNFISISECYDNDRSQFGLSID